MRRGLLAVALLVPIVATGQEWPDFQAAFPPFPCPDGWSGCIVDEARLGRGSEPLPTDLRVGWFDLTPTPVFSPFSGLSTYPDEPPEQVASAGEPEPEAAPEPAAPKTVARTSARRRPRARPAPPPPPALPACTDLVALEGAALNGQLEPQTIECLEQRVENDPKQTSRRHASHLLMADAEGRGDFARWERLALRHLGGIDRSNPALCYKLALYLEQQGPSRAAEVIGWSELAMENARRDWRDEQYTDRVYALHRLRSKAANDLWLVTEQRQVDDPSPQTRNAVEKYRGQAKNYAREWYQYARRVGKDTTHPRELCLSAAGTSEFCEVY